MKAEQNDQTHEQLQQQVEKKEAFANVYLINRSKDFILFRWKYNDGEWQIKNAPVGQTPLGDLKFCVDNGKSVHIGEVPCKAILDLQLVFFDSMSEKEITFEVTNTVAIEPSCKIILVYSRNDLKQYIEGVEGSFYYSSNALSQQEAKLLNAYFHYVNRSHNAIGMIVFAMLLITGLCLWIAFKFKDCFICYFVTSMVTLFILVAMTTGLLKKIKPNSNPDLADEGQYAEQIKNQKCIKAFCRITRITQLGKEKPQLVNIFIFSRVEKKTMKFSIPASSHAEMGWNTNDIIYMEYFYDSYLIKVIKFGDKYLKHNNVKLK